ncbi:MAG: 30S ribosome-binding factor RbfA [Spirochaetaceae bacterium]|jgi:ribosome-binding factor A|nr:30S ribosome-binding factor RbfA [Spirochaetaceae bacterium]
MGSFRMERLASGLRDEISAMILSGVIKDRRVSAFLSVNRVEVSSDLSYAKVWVSSFENESRLNRGVEGLQSAAGFIQTVLSKKLRLCQFPRLTFIPDRSIKEGFEMVKKLDSLVNSAPAREGEQ